MKNMKKPAEISIVAACLPSQACKEKTPIKQKLEKTKKSSNRIQVYNALLTFSLYY